MFAFRSFPRAPREAGEKGKPSGYIFDVLFHLLTSAYWQHFTAWWCHHTCWQRESGVYSGDKIFFLGAGALAQWLRVLVPAKHPGLIFRTHMEAYHLLGHQAHMWHTCGTHAGNTLIWQNNKNDSGKIMKNASLKKVFLSKNGVLSDTAHKSSLEDYLKSVRFTRHKLGMIWKTMDLCFWGYKSSALWNMRVLGDLENHPFTVGSDHSPVCFVENSLAPCTKRWTSFLSEAATTVPLENPSSPI